LMIGARDGDGGSSFSIVNDNNGVLGEVLTSGTSTTALDAALDFFYNAPLAPGGDTSTDFSVNSFAYTAGSYKLDYVAFSSVDVAASDNHDDVVMFQNGTAYYGGERANDADLFIGDFTFDASNGFVGRPDYGDLTFIADTGDGTVYDVGNDIKLSGFERFHLRLSDGNDTVIGGEFDDFVSGDDGNDYFEGGLGDDVFVGGDGDDTFVHAGGNDHFAGGNGTNTVSLATLDRGNLVLTLEDAGSTNLTDYNAAIGVLSYSDFQDIKASLDAFTEYTAEFGAVTLEYTYGANSLMASYLQEVNIVGGQLNDVMMGGSQTSSLIGGDGNDVLISVNGDDFLVGGTGTDTYVFLGGVDNNVIFDETGSSTQLVFVDYLQSEMTYSFDGTDLLIDGYDASEGVATTTRVIDYFSKNGDNGRNFTFVFDDYSGKLDLSYLGATADATGSKFNQIDGTEDNDTLAYASHLADLMLLGTGNDFVLSSLGEDLINGGAGSDGVSYVNSEEGVQINLSNGEGFGGTAEGDLLVSVENIAGSNLNDMLNGSAADNTLNGGGGNDVVSGFDGDDVLTGAEGKDTLNGGEGVDTLYGDEGNDTLDGGARSDILFGGGGKDTLFGGGGADFISDGIGNDTSSGGAGNDIFFYEAGNDTWNGGNGKDWADFSILAQAVSVDLQTSGEVMREEDDGSLKKIATLTAIENIRGSLVDDDLQGNAEDNNIDGSLGADVMTGHAGDDDLIGDAGFDTADYSRETGTQGINLVLSSNYEFADQEYLEGLW